MPLKFGKSKKAFRDNMGELLDSFKVKGKIGSSTPLNKKAAVKQALAISFSQQRKRKKIKNVF